MPILVSKNTKLWLAITAVVLVMLFYPDAALNAAADVSDFVVDNILPKVDKASMNYLHWRGKAMTTEESKVDGD